MNNIFKKAIFAFLNLCILASFLTSCSDFLDRPTEDSYTVDNYYQDDDECIAGVNYLYNSPWYDYQRGYFKIGEVLSGNLYMGSSPYLNFTVNGTDADLINASYSLWAVIGHCNSVYNSIKDASATESVKDQCLGECLTWKAMAYFYLVRNFGDVPIVHDNSAELNAGTYNTEKKVYKSNVYDYIIMTLERADSLLTESEVNLAYTPEAGRITRWGARGLLSKVYLTKAGVSGSINKDDMAKAADYAKDVIDNSGLTLMENYSDIFRLQNNKCDESLIAWRWTANGNIWTAQNSLQCDLGLTGFDEFGDTWGDWTDPSVDLQQAFGVYLCDDKDKGYSHQQPDAWINNVDSRLKATMMLPGFKYDYFWQDKGGFDYLRFMFDTDYNGSAAGQLNSATGANCVKHLYGNANDHVLGAGHSAAYMYNSLATHLLRLADVYLVYAEAKCGGRGSSTTDKDAIKAFTAVRQRAVPTYQQPAELTWDDIWKERRLELALEGDRWFDYVRVSYYDPQFCIDDLKAQRRYVYWGLSDLYKDYESTSNWNYDSYSAQYGTDYTIPNPEGMMRTDKKGIKYFFLPFPTEDVTFNANMGSDKEGEDVDVRSTYKY